jgi:hypothetical protein
VSSPHDDPAEQLLDLLVYAPLGLLFEARDLLPKLAEKGRQRMGGQVTVARMVGELAVRQGQRRAEQVLERLRQQNSSAARTAPSAEPTATSGRTEPPPGNGLSTDGAPGNGHRTAAPPPAAAPAGARPPVPVTELAIPGYDTLSASQVVPRLEGLSDDELAAVRAYEEATRARKTVLTRIDQLRGRS